MSESFKWTILILGFILVFKYCNADTYKPRRIKYAGCYDDVDRPKAVFMSCANSKGICEVRKGNTHTLRAFFWPKVNSTAITSHVAWNNGWFPVPLPNQIPDVCDMLYNCPMKPGKLNSFTYELSIDDFWPGGEYPVIWTLTDEETDEDFLCFKFRISIP